jgi:hypothetical protein
MRALGCAWGSGSARIPGSAASRPPKSHSAAVARHRRGAAVMTEYLIAGVLFIAIVTTLLYLWKREHD